MQALGVKPIARIVAQATSGLEPKMLLMTPVEATRKVLKKAGWFAIRWASSVQAGLLGPVNGSQWSALGEPDTWRELICGSPGKERSAMSSGTPS